MKKIIFVTSIIILSGLYSCSKTSSVQHLDDGRKHYRVLVTWTGNRANLVNHASGDTLDVAQDISIDFSVTKGDTSACCVGDKRIIDSIGRYDGSTEFDNADLLSNDSLWAITDGEKGVDTLHIHVLNDEELDYSDYYNSGPKSKVVPPAVSVRLQIFPPNSQTLLFDTTIHMTKEIPPCTENCEFYYSFYLK